MKLIILPAAALLMIGLTQVASAQMQYNPVPKGDPQYAQCLSQSVNNYTGGNDPSPVPGMSKVAAFCSCMWNETPENFKGNLGSFAETPKGAAINKTCEAYSGWS